MPKVGTTQDNMVEEGKKREGKSWVKDLKRGVLSSRRQSWFVGALCVT